MKFTTHFFNTVFLSVVLAGQATAAEYTYLFDPTNMIVGQSVGENLTVKESCSDPSKTSCTTAEKVRYVTAIAGRTGRLEIPISIVGDVDLSINADWYEGGSNRTIALQTADNFSLSIKVNPYIKYIYLEESTGVSKMSTSGGSVWQSGYGINDIRLTIQSGTAFVSVNGSPLTDLQAFVLSKSNFVKLIYGGIIESDRLFETKSRCISTACTSTTPAGIKFVNISTRAPILGGANNPIAGFIISGTGTQKVMITARGKSVNMPSGVCQDSTMSLSQLVNGSWTEIANNDDWQEDSNAGNVPANFQSILNATDAALRRDLASGIYTANMGCVGGTGVGLIGVDVVP